MATLGCPTNHNQTPVNSPGGAPLHIYALKYYRFQVQYNLFLQTLFSHSFGLRTPKLQVLKIVIISLLYVRIPYRDISNNLCIATLETGTVVGNDQPPIRHS